MQDGGGQDDNSGFELLYPLIRRWTLRRTKAGRLLATSPSSLVSLSFFNTPHPLLLLLLASPSSLPSQMSRVTTCGGADSTNGRC